jgi:hemoglobin
MGSSGNIRLQNTYSDINRYLKCLFKERGVTAVERREQITAEISERTGITEAMIERLVRAFYAKVREYAVLAPIFDARIREWEPHLQQMCAFWSSVALMSGRYRGTPMVKHLPLPVDAEHFDRWLALFEATAGEVCPPEAEAHFVERARRIAASLELGIASGEGVFLGRGERFRRNQAGEVR